MNIHKINLPETVCGIPEDVMVLQQEDDTAVADYLSDNYGFCIFSLDVIKNPDNTGMAKNICWDTTD